MMLFRKKGLLFSHIPKTAGTSFRKATERYARRWTVYGDYGEGNATTSGLIEACYADGDFSRVATLVKKKTLLAGHFHIDKYTAYYPLFQVISFVRDPVQRVISHYHDLQKRINYSGSLEEYVSERRYQNIQSHFFRNMPLEGIGFIGISEFYQESLDLIRKLYGLETPVTRYNENENKKDRFYFPSGEMSEFIRTHNKLDCEIYEKAMRLFLTRQQLTRQGLPYVYGKVSVMGDTKIQGWAVNPLSRQPVRLEFIREGKVEGEALADGPVDGLEGLDLGRRNQIGFSYHSNKPNNPDSRLEIRVAASGQLIG